MRKFQSSKLLSRSQDQRGAFEVWRGFASAAGLRTSPWHLFILSPRRGRQNKAWGASPRKAAEKIWTRAHEMGDSAAARFAGSDAFYLTS